MSPSPSVPSYPRDTAILSIQGDADFAASCIRLFQRGFFASAPSGASVRSLLTDTLGLEPAYIEARVTTIFLDGKPVDDLDRALVQEGATLTLSGAMPGLVGAAMRRGGPVAALRSSITFSQAALELSGYALVRLKLFNMVLNELGPGFLSAGVLLRTEELADFLKEHPVPSRESVRVLLDGHPLAATLLPGRLRAGFTRLSVVA